MIAGMFEPLVASVIGSRAHEVVLGPAVDAGDAILGEGRLAVMELQAVAQLDRPLQLIVRDGVALGHLRVDIVVLVEAVERVEHQMAVDLDDGRGAPDRIEDVEVRLGNVAEFLLAGGMGRRSKERSQLRKDSRLRGEF